MLLPKINENFMYFKQVLRKYNLKERKDLPVNSLLVKEDTVRMYSSAVLSFLAHAVEEFTILVT